LQAGKKYAAEVLALNEDLEPGAHIEEGAELRGGDAEAMNAV